MSPNPHRGTPSTDATLAIRRLARDTGGNVQELQTLYVLESFLARIAASPYREDFIVKGGVLLAAFALRRPTKYIDLLAIRISNDLDDVADRIGEIAVIDLSDGIFFNTETITASVIRDEDEYSGIRVKLVGALDRARLPIGIDVSFGDPVWPIPTRIELPRIVNIGLNSVQLLGYPLTMVLAEKLVTAIDRGETNTRWRDYADVYTIIRRHRIDANQLRKTLEIVAAHRQIQLQPLLPRLKRMPLAAQTKWRAWRTRVRRENELPETFADVLNSSAAFTDPIINNAASDMNWTPRDERWI